MAEPYRFAKLPVTPRDPPWWMRDRRIRKGARWAVRLIACLWAAFVASFLVGAVFVFVQIFGG